jgi:hypothetical protein
MDYGQFCPVALGAEIFAERWTPLILRELLMGGRRFTDIQRRPIGGRDATLESLFGDNVAFVDHAHDVDGFAPRSFARIFDAAIKRGSRACMRASTFSPATSMAGHWEIV